MDTHYVLESDDRCRSVLGVSQTAFAYLLVLFEREYVTHMNAQYEAKHGKKRTRIV